jgi:hypothetical protein
VPVPQLASFHTPGQTKKPPDWEANKRTMFYPVVRYSITTTKRLLLIELNNRAFSTNSFTKSGLFGPKRDKKSLFRQKVQIQIPIAAANILLFI